MASKVFTYTVPTVYQDGVACDNPNVTFDVPDCIDKPCIIEGNTITIEFDPANEACNCIHVIVDCPDDCDLCDPVVIKKCFCISNDDCPDCNECDDNGICQPLCPDKPCVNDYCVDCETDADCDYNQICFNGECTCPPGLVKDSLGRCVECLANADCDECEACIGGECVPKCPSDFCIDGTCTGCLIDSDCTGDNECCVDGSCECCEGYVWDPSLGTCVVQPDCITSGDCPDCYNCVETVNGKKCEPTQCPPGYVAYYEGDKCCYRECDCSNPNCPPGEYCREVLNGKCICTPNKCQGPCSGPEDCGEGCGCLDGQCVDCSTLNCDTANDCERALGCGCNDNGSCEASNDCDNQPCVTPADCPHNCGCDNNDCVDCTDVPCSEPDHCPFGCYCESGIGMCRPNPCVEVYCETGDECGPGCGCDPTSNRCIPCSSVNCDYCQDLSGCKCEGTACIEDPDDSCQDELSINKDEQTCDIVVTMSTNDCCECDEWSLYNTITATTQGSGTAMDTFTLNTELQGVNTDPVNWEVSALINYSIVHEVKQVVRDTNGNISYLPASDIVLSGTNKNVLFSGQPSLTDTRILDYWRAGRVFTHTDNFEYEVVNVKLFAVITGAQEVTADCEYQLGKSFIFEVANPASNTEVLQRTSCKNPVVSLYRSNDDIFTQGDYVLDFYMPKDPTAGTLKRGYRLSFKNNGLEDEIVIGDYYRVTTNCGCDVEDVYSCFASDVPTPLIFNYWKNNNIVVVDSGDSDLSGAAIVFERDNADGCFDSLTLVRRDMKSCLNTLNTTPYNFELVINGVVQTVGALTHFEDFNVPQAFNIGEPITSIVIRMVDPDDVCNQYTLTWNAPVEDVCECTSYNNNDSLSFTSATPDVSVCTNGIIDFVVAGGDEDATYTVHLYQGNNKLDTVSAASLVAVNALAGVTIPAGYLGLGYTYTLVVEQTLGTITCDATINVNVACDCGINPPVLSYDCGTQLLDIIFETGTVANTDYDDTSDRLIRLSDNTVVKNVDLSLDADNTVQVDFTSAPLADGLYKYEVLYKGSTGSGCNIALEKTININCSGDENFIANEPLCSGVDQIVTLTWNGGNGPYNVYFYADNLSTPLNDYQGNPSRATTVTQTNGNYKFLQADLAGVSNILFVLEDTNGNRTNPVTVQVLGCDGSGGTFTANVSSSCNDGTDQANLTITTDVNDTYNFTITPDPFTGSGSYTGSFTGTSKVINGVTQGVAYDIVVSNGGGNANNLSVSPVCTGPGPVITYTYACGTGLALFSDGSPLAGGTGIFINGVAETYNLGLILPAGTPMITVPGSTPIYAVIPNCCENITFSYVVNCSPLSLDYTLGGGSGDYDVTFQGTTYPSVGDGTTNIAAPSTGTHIMSIYDNVNECTTNKTVVISDCDATATVTEQPTCFTGDFGDGPVDQGKIYEIEVSGCDLGAITVDFGTPTAGGDETTVTAWSSALAAGTNLWGFRYEAVFDTCYEAFYIPGNEGGPNLSCAQTYNGWYIPNGIWIRINIGAGSGCSARTVYKFVPATAIIPGCSECEGFFCT